MALDGIFLSLIKKELMPLIGARVDRIYQPSRDELVIGLRDRNGGKRLLINAGSGSARIHLTEQEIENPKTPPMFCMLMRKHLSSGRLVDVRQDGFERILYLDFESLDELGDRTDLTLVVEIMGRCTNVVLVNGEGKTIDSIRRVYPDGSARPVLPTMLYTTPPREDRLDIFNCTRQQLQAQIEHFPVTQLSRTLLKLFEGISPIFARECEYNVFGGADATVKNITKRGYDLLYLFVQDVKRQIDEGSNTYTLVKTPQGELKDFCFCRIKQYGSLMQTVEFDSPSKLLDSFYSQKDSYLRTKQKATDLFRLLANLTERTKRRVQNQKQELLECADRDKFRIYGDLITANLNELIKGMSWCSVVNYYDPLMSKMEIPLDSSLTPQQNAQKYYAKYRKLDTAEGKLKKLIAQGEEEIVYLDSVYESLRRAQTEDELAELREELVGEGYLKGHGIKGKASKQLPPMKFRSAEGFVIRVGRNNRQNDRLSCKEAEKTDVWLHTKDITGSHVIICTQGRQVPPETLLTAARLAAYFSKGRESTQVGVDYTLVKNVKKPNGTRPGMVVFTNNKTLYVTPFTPQQVNSLKTPL